jgi:Peptidase propeptide and YPEB domain
MPYLPATFLIASLVLGSVGALAGAPPAATAPAGLSMEQAVKMTEQRYHARVVKAETQRTGNQTVYTLRLLNDSGKVWTVHVDAATGAVH